MSNLLNSKKKQLLTRGPKIEPETAFSLDEEKVVETEEQQQPETVVEEKAVQKKPGRPKVVRDDQVTSVRLMKSTRSKLNALVQLGKADNVDSLIDTLVDDYLNQELTKDEKRIYQVVFETFNKK